MSNGSGNRASALLDPVGAGVASRSDETRRPGRINKQREGLLPSTEGQGLSHSYLKKSKRRFPQLWHRLHHPSDELMSFGQFNMSELQKHQTVCNGSSLVPLNELKGLSSTPSEREIRQRLIPGVKENLACLATKASLLRKNLLMGDPSLPGRALRGRFGSLFKRKEPTTSKFTESSKDPPDKKLNSALLLSRRTYPPRDSWNFCGLRWGKSTKARQIDRLLSTAKESKKRKSNDCFLTSALFGYAGTKSPLTTNQQTSSGWVLPLSTTRKKQPETATNYGSWPRQRPRRRGDRSNRERLDDVFIPGLQ
ncbi:hypothetical protein HAX54_022271 [Datura stramonium]|uniref:Uncharacterized protein n=1 Tax=Datura stramonium TaxID=4076 RepID=A0ABS8S4F5_DATST|nr:hypothetical protein [Datura stramonium]